MKGKIAKSYSKTSTLEEVRANLEQEFKNLENDEGKRAIENIIDHIDKVMANFSTDINRHEQIAAIETEPDSSSDLECAFSDSDTRQSYE